MNLPEIIRFHAVFQHQSENRIAFNIFFKDPFSLYIDIQHDGESYPRLSQSSVVIHFRFNLVAKLVITEGFVMNLLQYKPVQSIRNQIGISAFSSAQKLQ